MKIIFYKFIFTFLFVFSLNLSFAQAQVSDNPLGIIKNTELNIETFNILENRTFARPQNIIIAPIYPSGDTFISSRNRVRGLYYYFSSNRFNFKDIPFHFLIDKFGNIYEGTSAGIEQNIPIKDSTKDNILIGYLAEKNDSNFTDLGIISIENLIINLANDTHIVPSEETIHVKEIILEINATSKEANLNTSDIFGSWTTTKKKIIDNTFGKYVPSTNRYNLEIVSVDLPKEKVDINSTVVAKVKLKNTGKFTFFSDDESELILSTTSGSDSKLFLNNIWLSKSQISIIPTGKYLSPGTEEEFEIKVQIPFVLDTINESFQIKTSNSEYSNKLQFVNLKFEINRGGRKILEITSTDTGYLNIRSNPTIGSTLVGKASIGDRYEWINSQNGWYEIKYADTTGWVIAKYVKVI